MGNKIHNYQSFADLHDLENSLKSADNQDVMKALYPYRNKVIGKVLNKIINKFKKDYQTPKSAFEKTTYSTFMDYFTRKLSEEKTKEIEGKLGNYSMVLPCECDIESVGEMSDTSSIIRLKKPGGDVEQDFLQMGIDVSKMSFIDMKLQKCYYHRIHAPISGKIKKLTPVRQDSQMFGHNSLWIVEIDSKDHGPVILMLVGELSIQDFVFFKKEGDSIEKFEQIGRFDWGSQVVMLYDWKGFPGEMLIKAGQTCFVGDGVFGNEDNTPSNTVPWETTTTVSTTTDGDPGAFDHP